MEEFIECSICGCKIEDDIYEVEGKSICSDCYDSETFENLST
ncbi:MAG: hypothetical protein ACI4I6_03315 [Hominimerdicola sp.]